MKKFALILGALALATVAQARPRVEVKEKVDIKIDGNPKAGTLTPNAAGAVGESQGTRSILDNTAAKSTKIESAGLVNTKGGIIKPAGSTFDELMASYNIAGANLGANCGGNGEVGSLSGLQRTVLAQALGIGIADEAGDTCLASLVAEDGSHKATINYLNSLDAGVNGFKAENAANAKAGQPTAGSLATLGPQGVCNVTKAVVTSLASAINTSIQGAAGVVGRVADKCKLYSPQIGRASRTCSFAL